MPHRDDKIRIIFFAGKGGVGKTSIAAATGIKSAERGSKTVILSLDIAHSLSDIFNLKTDLLDQNKGRPIQIDKKLWIQELDIQEEIKTNWGEIYQYISSLLNTTGLDEVLAEELAILPGMEEVSLLLYINKYLRNKTFDVILLDCAPTGESLRFISIPTTLEWYMKKIFKLERSVMKYVRPVAKRISDVPLPRDDYFQAIEYLFNQLKGVDQILTDPQITSVRLVTNPEKVVLKETQRAFMYFCLHKMNIDVIIMNRILPETLKDSYFTDWLNGQKRRIGEAEDYFNPIPVLRVNQFKDEIIGYERLKILANQLYGKSNPLKRFFKEAPYRLTKVDGGYSLRLKLPFITKKDVELHKIVDELIIRIGSFKRHILLPRQVASLDPSVAKLQDQFLNIFFKGDSHE